MSQREISSKIRKIGKIRQEIVKLRTEIIILNEEISYIRSNEIRKELGETFSNVERKRYSNEKQKKKRNNRKQKLSYRQDYCKCGRVKSKTSKMCRKCRFKKMKKKS